VALVEGLYHSVRFLAERKREELRRRLQSLGGGVDEAAELSLLRQGKLARSAFLDDLLQGVPFLGRLEQLVEQAHVDLTVAQLLVLSAMAALAGGTALGILGGPVAGLVGALAGALTPTLVVMSIRRRRSAKMSEQLPDALDMMARSLRAGHALPSAFKLVASEMPNPVALEFGRAFEEQNLGMSFERAVLQMVKRTPGNRDLRIFAVSIIVQKETGGNLVEILEKIAETIRARYRFFGKLRTLTAEGRLSGVVLGALPIVTALLIGMSNPRYLSGLVATKMGQSFLVYAIASWLVGLLWLRKMSKVEL
jgi:tight adherence protein B